MEGNELTIETVLQNANLSRKELAKIVNSFSKNNEPPIIYHYTSAAGLLSILKDSKLWFTRWDSLNDTSENLIVHDCINEALDKYTQEPQFVKYIREINNNQRKFKKEGYIDSDLYLASFSANADSLAMWNCYSKNSRSDGYSIGFDNTSLFSNYPVILSKVIYDKAEQMKVVHNVLDRLFRIYDNYIKNQDTSTDTYRAVGEAFDFVFEDIGIFFKHSAFEVEKEVRVSIRKSDVDEKSIVHQIREKEALLIPHLEIPFDKAHVKSVTISPTLADRPVRPGLQALKSKLKMEFDIIQSKIPFRHI
ncbi:MAG: DUF2971 domain-containing protein [Akkermansia sp.]|nr:DUF2971 domain-containing protein [Akkermansia sp.]